MKKVSLILIATAMSSLTIFSCNSGSVKTAEKLETTYEYEGKKVELVGEFDAPFFTFSSGNSKTIPMAFVVKAHAMSSDKKSISGIILPQGSGKNNVLMDLSPDQKEYTLKNFYVFDNKGEKINLDQHTTFKITGTVHYTELKKPQEDRRADNFSLEMTDVVIEKD